MRHLANFLLLFTGIIFFSLSANGQDNWDPYIVVCGPTSFQPVDEKSIYIITIPLTNKALDVYGQSKESNAPIHQWDRHNGRSQQFRFEKTEDGYYFIRNVNSNLVLDIHGRSEEENAKVVQNNKNGGYSQQFELISTTPDSDTYLIRNRNSDKALGIYGGSRGNGTKIAQFSNYGMEKPQAFRLEKLSIRHRPLVKVSPRPIEPCGERWKTIASEREILQFKGSQMIRYGTDKRYVTKEVGAGTRCDNAAFGKDPAPGVRKKCSICEEHAPPPCTWKEIAAENQNMQFSGYKVIRYGANGKYVTKLVPAGSRCSNAVFGSDPARGTRKTCSICEEDAPFSCTWKEIADENQSLQLYGSQMVRYGANGRYVTKVVYDGERCSNATFGKDPAPGVRKKCSICEENDSWDW